MDPAGIVNAGQQSVLTDSQVEFFRANGFLLLRQLLDPRELTVLRDHAAGVIAQAVAGSGNEDYYYAPHAITGEVIPFRVEYIADKLPCCRVLLAHPFLLGAIRRLQGEDFIPTWDSLVFKIQGAGGGHTWHRDAAPYSDPAVDAEVAAIDVGIYLDPSDLTNCLWVIPGSHHWPEERAEQRAEELGSGGFDPSSGLPVPVEAGDAIMHNILTLHGSAASQLAGRRVVYYEFRQIEAELRFGPHVPDYIPLKQQMLLACLALRRRAPYVRMQDALRYNGASLSLAAPDALPATFRYPHEQFWRYRVPFRS